MNLEDIKRNLNRKKTNFTEVISPPSLITKPIPIPQEPIAQDCHRDSRLANKIFSPADEEEIPPANSEVWCEELIDTSKFLDFDNVRRSIDDFKLEDERYDWRSNTKRGKASRKNFTNFLKMSM